MLQHADLRMEMKWNIWDAAMSKILSGFGGEVIKSMLIFFVGLWFFCLFGLGGFVDVCFGFEQSSRLACSTTLLMKKTEQWCCSTGRI